MLERQLIHYKYEYEIGESYIFFRKGVGGKTIKGIFPQNLLLLRPPCTNSTEVCGTVNDVNVCNTDLIQTDEPDSNSGALQTLTAQ